MSYVSPNDKNPDGPTRKVIDAAYAHFCAQQKVPPSALTAQRFAMEVTESGAKDYHGCDAGSLQRLLMQEFGDRSASKDRRENDAVNN